MTDDQAVPLPDHAIAAAESTPANRATLHEPGCECLEYGCRGFHRSHGCYCDEDDEA